MKEIKVWVGNLGKYNEGKLVGEWFTLPVEMKEVAEVIGLSEEYEEWFIADYEAPFEISEYANIEELNKIAERMAGMADEEIKAVASLLENGIVSTWEEGCDMVKNGEVVFYYECDDMADVAYSWVHDMVGNIIDAVSNPQYYIDAEAIKRDLEIDGYFSELEEERGEEMDEEEKDSIVYDAVDEGIFNVENYFDYEALGRDMEINGTFFYLGGSTYIEVLS